MMSQIITVMFEGETLRSLPETSPYITYGLIYFILKVTVYRYIHCRKSNCMSVKLRRVVFERYKS